MIIIEAVLHRISKAKGSSGPDSTTAQAREDALPLDEVLTRTAEELRRIYSSSACGYGMFDPNEDAYPFPRLLREYTQGSRTFLQLSTSALNVIANKVADEPFATGGYALFIRYEDAERQWMMVAMLKLRPGTSVDDETLGLMETVNLDLDHLHEAARIDLTKWHENQQPYLSFIKRREGQDVSRYFRNSLGCAEYTDSKHHTSEIKRALEDYFTAQNWDGDTKRTAKQKFVEICEEQNQAGNPVNLAALSAVIDSQNPEAFSAFVQAGDYPVSTVFHPARSVYSKWRRISKSFGTVKVMFDVQDVANGTVDVDEDNGYMVIRNPPQDLIDQIRENRSAVDGDRKSVV